MLAAVSPVERERLRAEWRAQKKKAAEPTPEKIERQRLLQRERSRRHREREKAKAAASPAEREKLLSKWRERAKKAYSRDKAGRELSPEERAKWRAKWREKAKKAAALEAAGRAADAPERLRVLAKKRQEYRRRHAAKKYADDVNHRLSVLLRTRLRSAVRNGQKRGSAIRDLGCTIAELKSHLERQFSPGMTWENLGRGKGRWSIDHIFPMKRADLTDRAHVLAICNWRNLRPEWFAENVRKSARITPEARALFDGLVTHFRSLE